MPCAYHAPDLWPVMPLQRRGSAGASRRGGCTAHDSGDVDEILKPDLLSTWRDAILAAGLAERLATMALDADDDADWGPDEAEEIASLAEQAADTADRTANAARSAAIRARRRARAGRPVTPGVDSSRGT